MGSGTGGIRRNLCAGLLAISLAAVAAGMPGKAAGWRPAPSSLEPESESTNAYWIGASLVVLGGAALLADGSIQEFYQTKLRSETTDDVAHAVRGFGEGLILTSLMGAGYLTGRLVDDDRATRASLTAFQSFVLAGTLTEGVKMLARRDRPNQTTDPYAFNGYGSDDSGKSFISGHATHAFAAATAVALAYDDEPIVAVGAYGLASLTALSRINDNRHWTSDVLLGSAMGYLIGNLVHGLNQSLWPENPDLSVRPLIDGDTAGITVTLRF